MAKKEEKFDLDEFNFDDGTDFPSFGDSDFGFGPQKDTRKPVTKFASGMISGAKSAVLSDVFVRDFVKHALPKGYSAPISLADDTVSTLRDLYNSSARELKPLMNDIRRATGKVMPAADKLLPKALSDKLKKFSENIDEGFSSGMSDEERENNQVNMTLASIFKTSLEEDAKGRATADIKDQLREEMTSKRHRESMTALGVNSLGISQLVAYKTKIESGYQRKSLELQLRSYMLATKAFEESQRGTALVVKTLENIQTNTSLPDVQKLNKKEWIRNKFVNAVGDSIFSGREGFIRKLGEGIKNTARDRFGYHLDRFRSGLEEGSNIADTVSSFKEAGLDPTTLGGEIVGGTIAGDFGKWLGKKAKKNLYKIKGADKYINEKNSNKAMEVVENLPQYMQQWANGWEGLGAREGKLGKIGGVLDRWGITDFLKDSVKNTEVRPDMRVDRIGIGRLQEAVGFSNQNSRSLNEIIPGYLARIYRELQVIRTGDDKVGLTTFDHTRNAFVSAKADKTGLFNKIVDKDSRDRTRSAVSDIMGKLKTDGLSEEQRNKLGRYLVHRNFGDGISDLKSLSSSEDLVYSGLGTNDAETFANVFKESFANDSDGRAILEFRRDFAELGKTIKDQRVMIQDLVNAGYVNDLIEMGVLDKDGKTINFQKLVDYNLYGTYKPLANDLHQEPVIGGSSLASFVKAPSTGRRNKPFRTAKPLHRASGGMIKGPGNGTSDSVPVMMSNGEYVVKDSARRYYGKDFLDKLNQMKLPRFGLGGMLNKPKAPEPDAPESKEPAAPKSVLGVISDNVMAIRKILEERKSFGFGFTAGGFNPKEKLDSAKNWWKSFTGSSKQRLEDIKGTLKEKKAEGDVWVEGEVKPRLYAWKLKAGEYYDSIKKKVIEKWEDIDSEVRDETGKVVLDRESVKRAFVKLPTGEYALAAFTGVKRWLSSAYTSLRSTITTKGAGIYGWGLNKFLDNKEKLENYFDKPVDIYVGGEWSSPRLTAISMEGGHYYSAKTKKPITKLSQIDGPIKNRKGRFLITEEDLKKGLFDQNGIPIRGKWSRAYDLTKFAIKGTVQRLKDFRNKAIDSAKGLFGNGTIGKWFDKLKAPDGLRVSGNAKIVSLLTEIRDLLLNKFGKPIRKNSIEDMAEKEKEKKAEENKTDDPNAPTSKGGKSLFGFLGGAIASLFGKGKKKPGAGKDGKDGEEDPEKKPGEKTSWLDYLLGASAIKDIFFSGKKGIVRGLAKHGGGLIKNTGKAGLGILSALYGAGKWGLKKTLGTKAGQAAPGLLAKLLKPAYSSERAGMLLKGGLGLGKAGLWAGKKTLPTLLKGGLTMGKVGLGTLKGMGPAMLLSGLAYGANATGHTTVGKGLEYGSDALGIYSLMSALSSTGVLGSIATGLGAILASPVALGALIATGAAAGAYYGYKYFTRDNLGPLGKVRYTQYGFDPAKKEYVHRIVALENKLRKFVTIRNGYASLPNEKTPFKDMAKECDVDLADKNAVSNWVMWFIQRFKPIYLTHLSILDKIKPGVDLSDVDGSKLTKEEKKKYLDGVKWPGGPYNVMSSPFKELPRLPSGAKEVSQSVEAALKEINNEKAKKKPTAKKAVVGAGASAVAQYAQSAKKKALPKEGVAKPKTPTSLVGQLNAAGAAGNANPLAATTDRGLVYVTATGGVIVGSGNNRVDAMTVVRYKTYGLKAMEADKIAAIVKLEGLIQKDISFDSNKHAVWKGSPDAVLRAVMGAFGLREGSKRTTSWNLWFSQRFLPTYLTYATAIASATGKTSLASIGTLSAKQQVDVATAVYTATVNGASTAASVWTVSHSPWKEYDINTDVHSTDMNMQALKDQAKVALLSEQETRSKTIRRQGDNSIDPDSVKNVEDKGAWGNFKDNVSKLYNNARENVIGIGNTIKGAWNAAAQAMGYEGGAEITQPGNGTGGDINKIPMPKGQKGRAAFQDTIVAAAKMAGVDPNLMLTFAAIESSFDNSAHPGTSRAQGLFQFVPDTWREQLGKYGKKYGIAPQTGRLDARANSLMGAEFMKENIQALKKIKNKVTDVDVYAAHLMGMTGVTKFFKASSSDIAAKILPRAAAANAPIFGGGSYGPYRTVGQVYQYLTDLVRRKGKAFGLGSGGGSEAVVAKSNATPAAPKGNAAPKQAVSSHDNAPVLPSSARNTTPAAASTTPAPAPTPASTTQDDVPQQAQSAKKKRKRLPSPAGTVSTTPTPAAPDTGTVSTDSPIKTPVDFGFNPNAMYGDRSRALKVRNEANNDQLVNGITTVNDVLAKSYEEHKAHTKLLTQIAEAMAGMAKATTKPVDTSTGTVPSSPASPDTSWLGGSSLPDLPVSLAKPV